MAEKRAEAEFLSYYKRRRTN